MYCLGFSSSAADCPEIEKRGACCQGWCAGNKGARQRSATSQTLSQTHLANHFGQNVAVLKVKRIVNLIEEVKRRRVTSLNGKDERRRDLPRRTKGEQDGRGSQMRF
jgi:hypothetical protein